MFVSPVGIIVRKPHILKGNKQTQLPYHFIFFDCETLPWRKSPTRTEQVWRLAVGWHVEYKSRAGRPTVETQRFAHKGQLWAWIVSKATNNKRLYVVAHNAEFDFRVSGGFDALPTFGYKMVKGLYDSAMFTLFWRKGRSTIVVINSYQWLPVSIEALGEILGIPKMTMPAFEAPDSEWYPYCERDVEILAKAVDAYRQMVLEHDLGTFSLTIASQAFTAFRHRFKHADIYIHNRAVALELERDGYYGGRVECYRLGEFKDGPYYRLDVNSMYPSVMKEAPYPVKLTLVRDNPTLDEVWGWALTKYAIARCKLNTAGPYYPKRFGGRLTFPIGEYWTVLHQVELLTALSCGDISEVSRIAVYDRGDLFSSYVSALYALRRQYDDQGNAVFAYIVKLLLNSLYGKFGQRGRTTTIVGETSPGECWVRESTDATTGDPIIYRCIKGTIWKEERQSESYHSFPAIAGAVTAYGRHQLLSLISKASWPNVYYVDTDSLIVNATGLKLLSDRLSPTELGGLKIEAEADEMTLLGLKRYTFGGDVKNKGIKKDAKLIGPNLWQVEKWRQIRSALMEGDLSHYYVDTVNIQLQGAYTKGVVLPDGTVRPILLKE